MNKKALSPVAAAIILIAVVIAVSLAIAARTGTLLGGWAWFPEDHGKITYYVVPSYPNATHVKWWIGNNWRHNETEEIVSLPCNASIYRENPSAAIWLTVTYYRKIAPETYEKLATKEYDIQDKEAP